MAPSAPFRLIGPVLAIGMLSTVANVLMLTGPVFMLQVYDQILPGGSTQSLLALFLLVGILYAVLFLIDLARGRAMVRLGLNLCLYKEAGLFPRALDDRGGGALFNDLDALRQFFAAPVALALFDLPFAPFYLSLLFVFDPAIGFLGLGGAVVLILSSLVYQRISPHRLTRAAQSAAHAARIATSFQQNGDTISALGIRHQGRLIWQAARQEASDTALRARDLAAGFGHFSRTTRLFLQSALLALGAALVMEGRLSTGMMVASSILLGRALAPVEQLIGQSTTVFAAAKAWRSVAKIPPEPPEAQPAPLSPKGGLCVRDLSVLAPDAPKASLRGISFTVDKGQAVGVIGPSGAGKSTLAHCLAGGWPASSGTITFGDRPLPADHRGLIGYMPQKTVMFEASIAQNIARLHPDPDPDAVIRAARAAAIHDLILDMPQGYDTLIDPRNPCLSGGQLQRVALARALYDDPMLLILDEPNAHLDNEGGVALNHAIRAVKARGGIVVIMTHRPGAIQECDLLLVLDKGLRRAFGPQNEVLQAMVKNVVDLQNNRRRQGSGR